WRQRRCLESEGIRCRRQSSERAVIRKKVDVTDETIECIDRCLQDRLFVRPQDGAVGRAQYLNLDRVSICASWIDHPVNHQPKATSKDVSCGSLETHVEIFPVRGMGEVTCSRAAKAQQLT